MVAGGPPLASLQSKERKQPKVRSHNFRGTYSDIKFIEMYIDT